MYVLVVEYYFKVYFVRVTFISPDAPNKELNDQEQGRSKTRW